MPTSLMHHVSDLDDLNPLIGLPPRLFPSWGAPENLLAKRRQALARCWHPSNSSERGVTAHQQAEIHRVNTVALEAYSHTSGTLTGTRAALGVLEDNVDEDWGSFVKSTHSWGPPLTRSSMVPSFNTTLPHFAPSCARECSASNLLSDIFHLTITPAFFRPSSNITAKDIPSLKSNCRCLVGRLNSIRLYWAMLPPRHHPAWADRTLDALAHSSWSTWNPIYTLLQAWGTGWPHAPAREDLERLNPCHVPAARREYWIETGWASETEFESCKNPQERIKKEAMQRREAERRNAWNLCKAKYERNEHLGGCGIVISMGWRGMRRTERNKVCVEQ